MYFLFNPLSWLSDGLGAIAGGINHAIRSFFYMLDKLIYQLVIYLYNTFEILCHSRLLDSELMSEIAKRIGFLLGIIMFFIVIFSFIKILVDPDKMTDSKTGVFNIVKKSILVIVMLGTSQFVFNTLYKVQSVVIKERVINKLLIPYNVDTDNFGALLSAKVFTGFYSIDSNLSNSDDSAVEECRTYVNLLTSSIYYYGSFEAGNACLNETVVVSDESGSLVEQEIMIIDYNWLLATVVGIALAYFMFMYCISIGVRTIQLAVLEVISPMAIISYLSPKDDTMFSKWSKKYVATYLDVFIRIAIINFIVFLIATILDDSNNWVFWKSVGDPSGGTKVFIMVVMIIALLTFAKKAPELIKALFPGSGSGIGFGVSMKDAVGLGALAAGATAVGVGTIGRIPGLAKDVKNAQGFKGKAGALVKGIGAVGVGGAIGAIRGAAAGNGKSGVAAFKAGQQAQAKANLARAQRIASGTPLTERVGDAAKGFLGIQSGYSQIDTTLAAYNSLNSLINDEDIVKDYQRMRDAAIEAKTKLAAEGRDTTAAEAEIRRADAQLKAVKSSLFESIVTGNNFVAGATISDADGNSFQLIGDIKANDSMKNALSKVEAASGNTYTDLKTFKTDRNKLQAERMSKTKSG